MSIETENINTFIEKTFRVFSSRNHKNLNLEFLKDVKLNNKECFYLLDLFQNEIIFKRNFTNLLGYEDDEITLDFLFNNFHPNDSEIIHRITKAAILYCIDYTEDSASYQLFLTYRHRTKDGSYIKVLNQVTIFDTNKDGVIKTLLIRLSDISFLDGTNNVNWTFKTHNSDESKIKEWVYKPYKNFFTKRELEVIAQISKKLSNEAIGQQLNISKKTVASHRKNIYKKARCHNQEELIVFCKGIGIL